jgi:hypothetical protein
LNRGVSIFEAFLVPIVVRGESDKRGDVTAGRATRDRNERRVRAVFLAMLANPCECSFGVVQVIGEGSARTQSVVRGETNPARSGQMVQQG